MPPTNRPRLLNSQQSPHNPINNNNNPPANIVYSIVQPSSPAPPTSLQSPTPIKPPTETEDRNLRRINREARMKQNQQNREARKKQNLNNNNDKKIDAIPPPIDNLKTPEDIVIIPPPDNVKKLYDNPFPKGTGNNPQFLLLAGGSLLVVGLIIAMNKR